MRRCANCGCVYEDTYRSCPLCHTPASPAGQARPAGSYPPPGGAYPPPGGRPQGAYPPPGGQRQDADDVAQALNFEQRSPGHAVINGAVAECSTQQYYQSRSTKLIHALFSGEPYQLGHTTFVTIFRVEEHRLRGFPEHARDITVYGSMQNLFAVGDDVTVHAKRRGRRYIARRIYNHSINSAVHIQPYIPAWLIRLSVLALALLAAGLIHGVVTADYAAIGQRLWARLSCLLPSVLLLIGMFYAVKTIIKPK